MNQIFYYRRDDELDNVQYWINSLVKSIKELKQYKHFGEREISCWWINLNDNERSHVINELKKMYPDVSVVVAGEHGFRHTA